MMNRRDEPQWSDEESRPLRSELRELNRPTLDASQQGALEDKTVLRLRKAGLLAHRRRWTLSPTAWGAVAAAVMACVFWAGFAAGRSSATDGIEGRPALGLDRATFDLQRAANRYADSLAHLTLLAGSADRESAAWEQVRQAREVAVSALYSAAYETARLTPDDPVAVRILQGFQGGRHSQDDNAVQTRKVAWY